MATKYKFNWSNLMMVIFTQAFPLMCTLVFLIYSFKFAMLAGLNPGSITTLFSLTSIYVGILFYICFDEALTKPKIAGIVLIFACAVILAFDDKSADNEVGESTLTVDEMRDYGFLAILMAFCGPIFWTFRSYHAKKALIAEAFIPDDLAVDCNFFVGIGQCAVLLSFVL